MQIIIAFVQFLLCNVLLVPFFPTLDAFKFYLPTLSSYYIVLRLYALKHCISFLLNNAVCPIFFSTFDLGWAVLIRCVVLTPVHE